jgi:hypothetical protein
VGGSRHGRGVRGGVLSDDVLPAARDLYAQPPDGFIAARDALVKELKAAGKDDDAATVKKLRRPSVVAWAVNQAAREAPDQVTALRDAGQALRRAQRKALSGGGGDELRAATDERRAVVQQLVAAAVAAIGERGTSHRDAIAATLEAAAVDDELGERLSAGMLDKEAQPTAGFGAIEGFEVLTGGAAGGRATAEAEPEEDPAAVKRERAKEAREAVRRADAAERVAEKARARADDLKEKSAAAAEAAKEAETEARRLADEARTERKRADRAEKAAAR